MGRTTRFLARRPCTQRVGGVGSKGKEKRGRGGAKRGGTGTREGVVERCVYYIDH